MPMNTDHFHTHGPDELAMLRAECDKWHKAYDRVWEERMRSADRAIELEKENAALNAEIEMLKKHIANGDVSRITWIDEVAELEKKFQEAESCSPMLPINCWKKCSEELPEEDEEILFVDEDGCYYVGTMWRVPYPIDGEKEIHWQGNGEPECNNPAYWMPLPKAPDFISTDLRQPIATENQQPPQGAKENTNESD